MLSAESLGVIRETLPAVAGAIDEITPLFYSKMFAAHPELLRDLFNRGNQAAGEQPKALAASIAAFAGMVLEGNGAQYDSVLDRIAHKHASLGIVAEQYPIVYEHLFAAIAEVLGEAVTADVAKAWSEFYWLMADELIAREKTLYDAAGVAPGDVWLQAIVVRRQLESADVAGFELRGASGELPNFLPGQYISVQVALPDGARQIRQYSLSRGSTAGDWRIAVKRLNVGDTPAGEVSNFIYDNVFEGQQLRVSVPMGEFTLDDSADPLVLVSAGIGCTPIMGMLQELVATQSPREVVVLHADQSAAAHAYRQELADLVGRLPAGRLHTWYERAHVEHPADGIGRMSLDRLPIDLSSTVFVCGPRPFMSAINEDLVSLGIPQEQINHELFGPLASAVA
ncbi:FAD-binding oxidoreductase [Mycobacteroides abscessus subsp. bolletii]|uniref:globin domain-containing protein n=1 Tax=Mycobacteroides abscessus TaxID=36809 RepID=UPI000D872606|nr:globin domain-containing protein [Mycobacteroides abscessus]MDO3126104.1 FAD-binding oxidoreductase [Mycobacteroides abscessus subsp. bolletii]SPX77400.1 nitric oxide dioxygenase [Mycobacteroides abscessus]